MAMTIFIDCIRRAVASTGVGRRLLGLSAPGKLVALNVAVFLMIHLVAVVAQAAGSDAVAREVVGYLALPSAFAEFLHRPWTLITYMFTQWGVMDLLFNMVWLYWLGSLLKMATSRRRLAAVYLYGGVAGGVAFMTLAPVVNYGGGLLGASAAVMAVIAAVAVIAPRHRQRLLFVGDVELRWIAVAMLVLMDVAGWVDGNTGGHVAHIGGVMAGIIFGVCYRRGIDLSRPLRRRYVFHNGSTTVDQSERQNVPSVEEVLGKLRRTGYASLTERERNVVFRISRGREDAGDDKL